MSTRRLLFMVGLLTMVVLAAFSLPAIANEDRMGPGNTSGPILGPEGDIAPSGAQDNDSIETPTGNISGTVIGDFEDPPVDCWQYSDVFERWDWDCD
jgi:hypothetical protein